MYVKEKKEKEKGRENKEFLCFISNVMTNKDIAKCTQYWSVWNLT